MSYRCRFEASSNCCRNGRSIFFLPLLSPWNTYVMIWTQIVLGLDLTYTAFALPIIVGFQVSDVGWGYGKPFACKEGIVFSVLTVLFQSHVSNAHTVQSMNEPITACGILAVFLTSKFLPQPALSWFLLEEGREMVMRMHLASLSCRPLPLKCEAMPTAVSELLTCLQDASSTSSQVRT